MSSRMLRALGLPLAWLLATGIAAFIAWEAVVRLSGSTNAASAQLSQAEIRSELAQPTAPAGASTAPPQSGGTGPPLSSPSGGSSSPPSTGGSTTDGRRFRSWSIVGGSVGVSCQGSVAAIGYASPNDGWSMGIEDAGPQRVRVEFRRGNTDAQFEAECVAGVPVRKRTADSDDGG